jgi:hypothetical protein
LKVAVNNNSSSASGLALDRSLEQMSAVFASGLQEWRERQANASASPSLKRKYDSLILTIRIQQLEQEAAKSANSTRTNQAFLNECIEKAAASVAVSKVFQCHSNSCISRDLFLVKISYTHHKKKFAPWTNNFEDHCNTGGKLGRFF